MPSLLSTSALLLRPSISLWRGEMTDRAISADIADRAAAERGSLRAVKYLVPKHVIDPISSAATELRAYIKRETLPWRWDGFGLCPNVAYLPTMDGWRVRCAAFDSAVDALLLGWSAHVAAGKRALGALSRDYDYPTADAIRLRFSARLEVAPVPDAADFRASLREAEADEIRAELEAASAAALAETQRFIWAEIQSHVTHIVDRLSAYGRDPKTGKVTGTFRDSLIANLRDLVRRLAGFNLAGDPAIDTIRRQLDAKLCTYDPGILREDEGTRLTVRDDAAAILSQLAGILPAAAPLVGRAAA